MKSKNVKSSGLDFRQKDFEIREKEQSETGQVFGFKEKARADQSWVNAGLMVLNKNIFDYLGDGSKMLEAELLEAVAGAGEMVTYRHDGFWSLMDTLRDKQYLEELWKSGAAPWKIWDK